MKQYLRNRYEKHYHPRHKHGRKHMIADITGVSIVILLLAFIGFIVFALNRGLIGRLVNLNIELSSAQLISGDDVTVKFIYQNQSEQPLQQASLSVDLPPGFIIKKTPPGFATDTKTLLIGDMAPRAGGELDITGELVGAVGSNFQPTATLNFQPTSFAFLTTNRVAVRPSFLIEDSILKLTVEAPDEVSNGQGFEGKVSYENTSSTNSLDNVIIESQVNDNFQLIDKLPDGGWKIDHLGPGEKGENVFDGKVDGAGAAREKVGFKAFVQTDKDKLLQAFQEKSLSLVYPKLKFTITSDRPLADLGSTVNFLIHYENDEDFDIKNLAIAAELDPNFYDLISTKSAGGHRVDRFVHWDASTKPELASVAKGSQGELVLTTRLKQKAPAGSTGLAGIILTGRYSAPTGTTIYEASQNSGVKVTSDLSVAGLAHYFSEEGDQIGRGPLPPVVGRETKYWVFVTVSNSFSGLNGVLVTLRLPAGVRWTGTASVPVGNGWKYVNGDLVWDIGDMAAGTKSFTAGMEVALTPTIRQLGTEPLLADLVKVTGFDTFTLVQLDRDGNKVSTRINDDQAIGKSQVGL